MKGCEMAERIGFIGLGAMGMPMTQRLLAAGHDVTVWGRTRDKLEPALGAGAKTADSAAALVASSDIVFTCVTDTQAVEDVVFGVDGIAQTASQDKLLVDHSTIHPSRTREWSDRLRAETGMGWVDAPVSGGAVGARAGELIVMAGGEAADIARASPVIEAYAQRISHMGPSGAGQATKACNQMIIGAEVAVIAEVLAFARDFGVDAGRLPDCLAGGWADSAVMQDHARRMAAADYTSAGDAYIMVKDLNIGCDLGRETGSPLPLANLALSLYQLLVAQGHTDKGQIGLMWLYAQEPL